MKLGSRSRVHDRFPITLGLMVFWGFAILTLPFLGLSVDATPNLSAKAEIGLTMFLTGVVLLAAASIIFTRGFGLIAPDQPFKRYTTSQALLVVTGFLLVSVWQVYVNQASLTPALQPYYLSSAVISPGAQTALTFKIDMAIAEEALFGAMTVLLYLTFVYAGFDRLKAAVATLPLVASAFTWFHTYVLGTNPAALMFIFGARLVLSGVLLGTLLFSRHAGATAYTASLAAPNIIHVTWNVLS